MKKITLVFLSVIILCMAVIPVHASDYEVMPCLTNVINARASFTIQDDGTAIANFAYVGYEDYFEKATVTSKIEKKILWWWSDVDGASWTDERFDVEDSWQHSVQLSSGGTYRLVFEFQISGNTGEVDVISDTLEKKY